MPLPSRGRKKRSRKKEAAAVRTCTASSTPKCLPVKGTVTGADKNSLAKVGDGALKLDNLSMEVDPPAEWKQIFNEVWRQQRDYFFEASMNGVNWEQQRDKYAQLLPYVADRLSLTYVLGEMIGELSNSHTYVGGGDYPEIDGVNVGIAGRRFCPRHQ